MGAKTITLQIDPLRTETVEVVREQLGKPSLSLLEMQRFAEEVHVQSYHLRSDCGLVLRTQTIFRIKSE